MMPHAGVAGSTPVVIAGLDRELKYLVPAGRMPFAERWLATICRADPQHPCSDVWTVYYDTAAAAARGEKVNSDYLKTKLRVRWYADPGAPPAGDAVIEVKRRIGDRRAKTRIPLARSAADLSTRSLDDPIWSDLLTHLLCAGVPLAARWRPALMLSYRRRRFLDAASGMRISCDSALRGRALPGSMAVAPSGDPLDVGVIECKGPGADELPRNLGSIVKLGAWAAAFSKYAAVFAHATRRSA
jgi:hypothetical protein